MSLRFVASASLLCALVLAASAAFAQRDPVLKQIDLPHSYYYREMYLPQLTTGPSAAAWTQDSRALIYSMAGSLWRQELASTTAEQLTAGAGYDYQPDCSLDGRWVVYSSYQHDAVELWALDLTSRQTRQLTHEGAVNVEPRFSPDGKRVVFVSTSYNGHFHIFVGDFAGGELANIHRLTGENRSSLPRYYYSQFDHEISPAWSPDGLDIIFVSNRGHIYGTGGFWRMKAEPGAQAREIHYEETAWKARPDFSPDGHRIVYASYVGQQWHQLWVMPSQGGDAFPLSYGDFDNVNPRWSPDGKRIAFISNRNGNTSLWTEEVPGGLQTQVVPESRRWLKPMGKISITVTDSAGRVVPARLFVTGEDGRAYAPESAWMQADDSFDRSQRPFEAHYFESSGKADVIVPAGGITVNAMRGFEYRFERRTLNLSAGQSANLTIRLTALAVPHDPQHAWISGDVHVHMNYGGIYRNDPKHLVEQAAAENLRIVEDLVVNKEQRIPDIAYFRTTRDPASTPENLLLHGQEFHTSYWGHLGLLNLGGHFILPGYSAYPNTAAASLYPTNADVSDMAHRQQGTVGYVHPFDVTPDPAKDASLTDELPVDVALGKVDYIEVVGFSDHKSTAAVWYRLLNCGFRLPTAAGTDAMANYASLRGPVGLNRVYVDLPAGKLAIAPWLSSLKQGHTFASNGPLIGFSLGGKKLGEGLNLSTGAREVPFTAWMRSIVPIEHLQVVCNGQVARDLKTSNGGVTANVQGTLPVSSSGWCVLRAWNEKPEYPVLDLYPYATTSPIYITVAGAALHAPEDATYFLAWIDRLSQAVNENKDWNTDAEKASVLDELSRARKIYEQLPK
ncbi:MAG TPA: CehA/McbA family metallohydrolase [Terriglobales bacterium]|nr:CehA/McbA family metallohydrolase [Terriglobales bacterium]